MHTTKIHCRVTKKFNLTGGHYLDIIEWLSSNFEPHEYRFESIAYPVDLGPFANSEHYRKADIIFFNKDQITLFKLMFDNIYDIYILSTTATFDSGDDT